VTNEKAPMPVLALGLFHITRLVAESEGGFEFITLSGWSLKVK